MNLEVELTWIWQHAQACLLVRENMDALGNTEGIKVNQLAIKVMLIARCDVTFYRVFENSPATLHTVWRNVHKEVCWKPDCGDLERYFWPRILLEGQGSSDNDLEKLGISQSDDVSLCTANREYLPFLIRATLDFVHHPTNPAPFRATET